MMTDEQLKEAKECLDNLEDRYTQGIKKSEIGLEYVKKAQLRMLEGDRSKELYFHIVGGVACKWFLRRQKIVLNSLC